MEDNKVIKSNSNKIKVKNITLMETPETDEALSLLSRAKDKYFIWSLVMTVLVIFFGIVEFIFLQSITINVAYRVIGAFVWIISIVLLIVIRSLRRAYLKPYYELWNIAKLNDKIRHEERIRFRERKRLEQTESKFDNVKITMLSSQDLVKQERKETQNAIDMNSSKEKKY